MTPESLLAFVAAISLWVLIPGPAVLMVVSRSLSGGLRSTVGFIGGILLGDVFYMSFVFLGLAALGQMLGEFFIVVRTAAAVYLIYLGVSLWRKGPANAPESGTVPRDGWKSFLAGFGLTLGNPKAILFHLGFLPTFFDLPSLSLLDAAVIMSVFIAVLAGSFCLYGYAAGRTGAFFRDPGHMRILNRVSGTLLIGAGATVLLKRA